MKPTALAAALLLVLPTAAFAQAPSYLVGSPQGGAPLGTTANPLVVTGNTGGGSSSGATAAAPTYVAPEYNGAAVLPATAPNQASQLAAEQAIQAALQGTLSSTPLPTQSGPNESTTTIATTSTAFGTAGNYRVVEYQVQGQPMCVTFGTGTPSAPSAAGVCTVGVYVPAGASHITSANATPTSQGKAAAYATGGSIWESAQ